MREVLRLPGYRAWLACRATSWFGDAVALLVLSMWVKSLTGSNGRAGLTFVFIAVPQLLGAFAGVLVDRLPKRGALIWGNVASAMAPVPLLFVRGAGDVPLIWVTAALLGVSYAVLPAVSQVILKQVVPTSMLTPANSLQSAIGNGLQLLGPLIGAGLFAWVGGQAVALVQMVCFLVSAALAIRLRVPPIEDRPHESSWRELVAGMRHIAATPLLRDITLALVILFSFTGFLESALYALCDAMGRPPTFASVVATAQGIGTVVGALGCGLVIRRLGNVRSMTVGLIVLAGIVVAVTTTTSVGVILPLIALAGLCIPSVFVPYSTLQISLTPAHLLGRVSTASVAAQGVANIVSLSVGAGLITMLPWQGVYLLIAAGALAAGAMLGLRWWRQPSETAPEATAEPTPVD